MCMKCESLKCDLENLISQLGEFYTLEELQKIATVGMALTTLSNLHCLYTADAAIDLPATKEDIQEELKDAEKWYNQYLETTDEMYLKMSRDELKHANWLLQKAKTTTPDSEMRKKIPHYENWYEKLVSKIGNPMQ